MARRWVYEPTLPDNNGNFNNGEMVKMRREVSSPASSDQQVTMRKKRSSLGAKLKRFSLLSKERFSLRPI